MTNGFYDTKIIHTPALCRKFMMEAIMLSYRVVIQEKYKKPDAWREDSVDSSIGERLDMLCKHPDQLRVIDRSMYNRGQIPDSDGEVCIVYDWYFIYCHMSLDNLAKLVSKYKLKLKEI